MLQTSVATLCFSEVWLLLSDIFELAWNQRAERNEGRGLKTVDAVLSLPVYREIREFREIRERAKRAKKPKRALRIMFREIREIREFREFREIGGLGRLGR